MQKKAQVAVGGAGMRAELFAKDEMVTSEDHVSTKCVCVCVCVLGCLTMHEVLVELPSHSLVAHGGKLCLHF